MAAARERVNTIRTRKPGRGPAVHDQAVALYGLLDELRRGLPKRSRSPARPAAGCTSSTGR
jgi:hypothetical protein